MVFHWSLSDHRSPQVSRTLLSILAVLNNVVVWMVSTHPSTSKSSSLFCNPLVSVRNAPITIGIIVTCMFHNFFNSRARSRYEVHTISLQTFFVWAFKICVNSWKFTMLLLYILLDNRPTFMISASNEQLQQQLEYTLLKPDCRSWWSSKMQSDTLEERIWLDTTGSARWSTI